MIRVFILDDDIRRINYFKNNFSIYGENNKLDFNINYACDVNSSIYYLSNNNYDFIFLDHDLDGKTFVDINDNNCGMRIADFLNKLENRYMHNKIIVHSLNINSGKEMCKRIKDSIYMPEILIKDNFFEFMKSVTI